MALLLPACQCLLPPVQTGCEGGLMTLLHRLTFLPSVSGKAPAQLHQACKTMSNMARRVAGPCQRHVEPLGFYPSLSCTALLGQRFSSRPLSIRKDSPSGKPSLSLKLSSIILRPR